MSVSKEIVVIWFHGIIIIIFKSAMFNPVVKNEDYFDKSEIRLSHVKVCAHEVYYTHICLFYFSYVIIVVSSFIKSHHQLVGTEF